MRGRRILAIVLTLVGCALPLAAIWMPIYGFRHAAAHFRDYPHGFGDYFEQLWPPFLQIFMGSTFLWFVYSRRNPPWWSLAAALVLGLSYCLTLRDVRHDFSHVIFQECSGIYGDVVWSIGGTSALCAVMALFLHKQHYAAEKLLSATQSPFPVSEA